MLASVIIEESLKLAQVKPTSISVAFFYCIDHDLQRNRFSCAAKAILAQLLIQNSALLPYLYDECLKSGRVTLESPRECERILRTVLLAVPKIYLIIDGIDECDPRERKLLLRFFTSVIDDDAIEPGKLRGMFISQESNDIRTALLAAEKLKLCDEHLVKDIREYTLVRAAIIQQRFTGMQDRAREYLVKLVCDGAEGMFLFAKLVLDHIHDQENLENVYKEMKPDVFPNGFEQAQV